MPPINVVHICDKFGMGGSTIHGAGKLFAWWMPRFDRRRFTVTLYALKSPDVATRALEAEGVALGYLRKTPHDPSTLLSIRRVIRHERADILHLHGWASANFGRLAGSMAGIPTIMHEHGAHPSMPLSQRIADRMLRSRTHTAVAVSTAAHDFLVNLRRVDPAKIRRIYNGAPLEDFRPAPLAAVMAERARLGIPDGAPVVGTVGRLSEEKGLDCFLQAAKLVIERRPDVVFLIVGDGHLREPLEALANALGIARQVLFTGYRTDIALLQSVMDVQTFASVWEGAPLTLYEAMAMGKTIVSTNVGGLGEILEGSNAALTVPAASPPAMADAIVQVISDRTLGAQLSAKAAVMGQRFDINSTVRQMESLYEELAGRPSRT